MAQEAQTRVQNSVNDLLTKLDKECLRKIKIQMFTCSANCDENLSMEEFSKCLENCSSKLQKAQSYVSNELMTFEGRLERCQLQCQDNVRDKITADTSEDQMEKMKKQYETCVVNCVDDTISLMPNLFKKMKSIIVKEAYHKV